MRLAAKLRRLATAIERGAALDQANRSFVAMQLRWDAALADNGAQVKLDWNDVKKATQDDRRT